MNGFEVDVCKKFPQLKLSWQDINDDEMKVCIKGNKDAVAETWVTLFTYFWRTYNIFLL